MAKCWLISASLLPSRPAPAAMGGDAPILESINSPVKSILKELLNAARRRKSGSYTVLYEAYSSLKVCPIQFTSVRQLLPLGGFGPALVDKIEMMLCDWCREHGKRYVVAQSSSTAKQVTIDIEEDEEDEETDSDFDRRASSKSVKGKAKAKVKAKPAPNQVKKKAAVEKEPKVFVPQHRSGTHGILVSLYTLTPVIPAEEVAGLEEEVGDYYYSKATVIHFGQPYSTPSYIPKETSAPGSGYGNFHCAWSQMKTLINRGYVYRRGNPARFGLSREGWKVAQTCTEREKGLTAGCNEDKIDEMARANPETSKKKKATSSKDAAIEASSSKVCAPFLYTYLDDAQPPKQTNQRIDASVRLSDLDYRMLYKIAFSKELSDHPFAKTCVGDVTQEGGFLFGWVKESVCNETAPGIPTTADSSRISPKPITRKDTPQPNLKATTEERVISDKCMNALQTHINNSQATVIELLTSSDVEFEAPRKVIKVKAKPSRRRQDSDDSDSELSDLAPIVKQRKTIKVKK